MAATVLVVDDDPVILRLLEVNFEMEGYTVLTASDGTRSVDSSAFTVSAGSATQLVFSTQPDGSANNSSTLQAFSTGNTSRLNSVSSAACRLASA